MAGAAAGIAVVGACIACYIAVRSELYGQVDDQLRDQAGLVQGVTGHGSGTVRVGPGGIVQFRLGKFERPRDLPKPHELPAPPERAGGPARFAQLVTPAGAVKRVGPDELRLPVNSTTRRLAAHAGPSQLSDVHVGGTHLRVLTAHVPRLGALQLARPLNGIDHVLDRLRLILAGVALAGIALAAALGYWAARRVMAPVDRLTGAAEQVAATDDLSLRVGGGGEGEVGRLARSFDGMLERLEGSRAALDASVGAQRQLVADASHELRTPVTSLRTNIELLLEHGEDLDVGERRRILDDVREQVAELGALVTDVVELARGDRLGAEPEDVRLDRLVAEAIERAHRHAPDIEVVADLEPVAVEALPDRLARAVNNLLDNAVQHSPPGGRVEVELRGGVLRVRDHGDGLPAADLPHVFDRFYRGANARDRHGSGLGLAIVRQVAEAHGGVVAVTNAPGGGAAFTLRLPGATAVAEPVPG
jgi:two-component system, OmpR family, sensor histidine kinase MprB